MSLLRFGILAACFSISSCNGPSAVEASNAPRSASVLSPANAEAEAPRLMADVAWLADDARAGRRAGMEGENAARDYLVARLHALGLEPGGEDGYLQAFSVPLPAFDAGSSSLTFGDLHLAGADLAPLFCSSGASVSGDTAWVGYGVVDAETGRDDYAGLDVTGKIVLVARGAPTFPEPAASAEPASSYGGQRTSFGSAVSIFTKVMNAKHHGAIGVVLLQDPDAEDQALLAFDAAQEAQAGLPCVMIGVNDAEALLAGSYADDLHASRDASMVLTQPTRQASVTAAVVRANGQAENVLGLQRGVDSSRTVVVGAHYDNLGFGGTGSLSSRSVGQVHNGADDNASGTAAVLELARLMRLDVERGVLPACNVLFALWSGEELGLLGSAHWVRQPTVTGTRIVANLNMDMVGRAQSGRLQVMGAGSSLAIAAWLAEAASRSGLDPVVSLSGHGIGGSDHQSFLNQGIPAVHLFTGVHTDYHKPSDDTERFEAESAAQVVEYARYLLTRLTIAETLDFVPVELGEEDDRPTRERGWSAWFGSIPDYTSQAGGLLISGVQASSPAERAGLLGGDVLIGAGSVDIDTIQDFVYALQLHKPGDVIRVRYLRGGVEQVVLLTLGSRELL